MSAEEAVRARLERRATDWLQDHELGVTTLPQLMSALMVDAQAQTMLRGQGAAKKSLVLASIAAVVRASVEDDTKRAALLFVADEVLPAVIDCAVDLARGGLKRVGRCRPRDRLGRLVGCCCPTGK